MGEGWDVAFLTFLGLVVAQRAVETIVPNRRREPGVVTRPWTWWAFSGCYVIVLGGCLLEYFFLIDRLNLAVSALGTVMVLVRIWLKWWAMRTLGKYWSNQIEMRQSHKLIREGPYRYLRHPAYFSNVMEYIALPLIANAYYTLLFVALIYVPLNLTRLYLEEKELAKRLGDQYRQYQREVPALLPLGKRGGKGPKT